jgi:hypothetical protein
MVHELDLNSVKGAFGVPDEMWSCHTVSIGGYVVEGHVPVEAIRRLSTAHSELRGIALPGMPAGSPGMSGTKAEPFEIVSFSEDGVRPFGDY